MSENFVALWKLRLSEINLLDMVDSRLEEHLVVLHEGEQPSLLELLLGH